MPVVHGVSLNIHPGKVTLVDEHVDRLLVLHTVVYVTRLPQIYLIFFFVLLIIQSYMRAMYLRFMFT